MTDVWDEKPPSYLRWNWAKERKPSYDKAEIDDWLDKLIMYYEDRLLRLTNKIEELLDDVATEQGFRVSTKRREE